MAYEATYHDHQSVRPELQGTSIIGALQQSATNTKAIQTDLTAAAGKLGIEKNDGGVVNGNTGGSAGMFARALKTAAVTAGVGLIAGPGAAAVVGAIGSAKDAGAFMMSSKSASPSDEGGYYSLKNSLGAKDKNGVYKNAGDDPQAHDYLDSSGDRYAGGFFMQPQQPQPMQMKRLDPFLQDKAERHDSAEYKAAADEYGALVGKLDANEKQKDATIAFARRNDLNVKGFSEGPKPPAGGPGFIAMPGMG